MSEIVPRLLAAAVGARDVQGLAAAIENVLALTADPCRLVDAAQVREAVELGLSSSPSLTLRTGTAVE